MSFAKIFDLKAAVYVNLNDIVGDNNRTPNVLLYVAVRVVNDNHGGTY